MTRSRIEDRFRSLRDAGRSAFIPYVMAGDPDAETTLRIINGLPQVGADLIELGFPFSDPMAEGAPIQRAAQRALSGGMTVMRTLDLVRSFRTGDGTTPLIMMGYLNNLMSLGFEAFAASAADAGVDGLIVVDCPPEEAEPLADALDRHGLCLIRLATPTSDDARLSVIAQRTAGFIYYVSVAGVTGSKEADETVVGPAVARVRAATGLPVAVGFGIKTPERAAAIARVADGAVVGSVLVEEGALAVQSGQDPAPRILEKARQLAVAIHGARI